ncbi:ADP-ribosylglycohydrolase family protein [Zooshikella marina]|uniref:ADP-ribosylglycohydrolase family protein n=1 Tax=Zooshikella ganghwensis TaxID=202772 RepID=UPI001BAF4C49|nr:ADP-ribosylglycohydrolase family protein [Zooshikella ganghwensis]MBU2709161.1 ADP-ribosylglycohydrolase family protein [Zooshikella ganghwensis]
MIVESKFTGCFIGLAIGDAYGAFYEGGILERVLWQLIGRTSDGRRRYTDDTQMSVDVAQSFLENGGIDQDNLAQKFASSYKWSRGYGPSAAKLLKGISKGRDWRELNRKKFPEGSLGNGAAMRAPVVTLCHPYNDTTLANYIKESAEITHAHPLAIEGAYAIAIATYMALEDESNEIIIKAILIKTDSDRYRLKLNKCMDLLLSSGGTDSNVIKKHLGNGILATESCITAIYFALKYRDSSLEHMLGDIFGLAGDADTIGAMAGSIWGAFNGVKSMAQMAEDVENVGLIESLAKQLYNNYLTKISA